MKLYAIFVFILGSIFGSFYACMGYRIPNKISLTKPGSFCENCKKEIKWYMNVPILSYIFLGGKCAYCKKKIDSLGFIVEILTGVLFALFYLKYGFGAKFLLGCVLISVMSVSIVSDFKYYYISDRVWIIGYVLSFIVVYYLMGVGNLIMGLGTSLVMFLFIIAVKLIGDKILKKDSLGGGDIKLLALIGFVVGSMGGMVRLGSVSFILYDILVYGVFASMKALIVASILALVYFIIFLNSKKDAMIAFGPFLLMGAIIVIYFVEFFSSF